MRKPKGEILLYQGNDVEAFMRSPEFQEFNKRCQAYIEQVDAEAVEGLTPEERAWFDRWRKGEALDWSLVPPKAYNAIMHAVSMGTG